MKLTEIAANLKTEARNMPHIPATHRLPAGAPPDKQVRVRLKFVPPRGDAPSEFHLQIQRTGSAPKASTIQMKRWLQELATFARDFGGPVHGQWIQQSGETTYAAVLCWDSNDAPPREPVREPLAAQPERALDPADTEIVGVLPRSIHIPSTRGGAR